MKPTTQLILMFVGAGVASYVLVGDLAAEKTADFPMVAAGGEGLAAAGGAYWALKKKSRVGAVLGGVAAGLLVSQAKGILAQQPVASTAASLPAQVMPSGFRIAPRHPEAIPQAEPSSDIMSSLLMPTPAPELLR